MKKTLYVRTVAMSAVVLAGATAAAGAQVRLGIIGGVNYASIDDINVNNVSETFDNRSGFHIGAFIDLATSGFAIRPGVQYLNAGALFEGATFLDPNLDNFNVSYVSFPLDLRARFGPVDVFAGPEFQVLASANAQDDFNEDLKSWVVNGGIGLGLRLGPLMPEVRYAFGLSGLTEDQFTVGGITINTDNGQRSAALRVSLGVAF